MTARRSSTGFFGEAGTMLLETACCPEGNCLFLSDWVTGKGCPNRSNPACPIYMRELTSHISGRNKQEEHPYYRCQPSA